MDLNKKIRDLIDAHTSNPYAYSSDDIRQSVINYTECLDFNIKDDDIKKGLNALYNYMGIDEFSNKSCIITNSVNGKIANYLYENIYIYSFDNDYYCSMVSQIVNAEKNKKDKIQFLFGDISQFFTSEFKSNFKTDFVITSPSQYNNTYQHLDSEMKFRKMNQYEYYTKRSIDFLFVGGICLSIVPTREERFIVNQLMSYDIPVSVLGTIKFDGGYSFIYIKKA